MKKADDRDPTTRIRDVLDTGIAAIEAQMTLLVKGEPTPRKTSQIVNLTKDAATIMGHVRRYDQALREETRRLTPSLVVAYLRGLQPDARMSILNEVGSFITDDEDAPSVLS